ncbi:hypothetical protein [Arthrobacter bambusae]|uniref:hypothetical protein n=1 Tax=Arthrobacter bambusae TaxID=1338426 RepID=UPI002786BDEF|nr:hypothetical protein [Arthrobacter bambusae]MDQ0242148.1 hypothetical protein [Arthrobacter bambusae]
MTATLPSKISPGMVEVRVDSASEIDGALNAAIAEIRSAATRYRTGVMVTRTGPGRYIVRAHPAVPYGLIRQQQ